MCWRKSEGPQRRRPFYEDYYDNLGGLEDEDLYVREVEGTTCWDQLLRDRLFCLPFVGTSWTLSGHFPDTFRTPIFGTKFRAHFLCWPILGTFWTLSGHLPDTFGHQVLEPSSGHIFLPANSGHFLDTFLTLARFCEGGFVC